MPAQASQSEFERSLQALAGPLEYAVRCDQERLVRVKNLYTTLDRATRRLEEAVTPPQRSLIAKLRANLPGDDEPVDLRLKKLQMCWEAVEALRAPDVTRHSEPQGRQNTIRKKNKIAQEKRTEQRNGLKPGSTKKKQAQPTKQPKRDSRKLSTPAKRPTEITEHKEPIAKRPGSSSVRLDQPVQYLRGVGPRVAKMLASRGLKTVRDVLWFLPRRYEVREGMRTVAQLSEGATATVLGTVVSRNLKTFRGRRTLDVTIRDGTGHLFLKWFRVPGGGYADRFQNGREFAVTGMVKMYRGRPQMVHPETRVVDGDAPPSAGDAELVPHYLEVPGLRPVQVRKMVQASLPAVNQLEDAVPAALLKRHGLPPVGESVRRLHVPQDTEELESLLDLNTPWHRRLVYEELLLLQLAMLRRKAAVQDEQAVALKLGEGLSQVAGNLFPFTMTGAQIRVLGEIQSDLTAPVPMHRLLQGDVGSGKTAVALSAAAAVALSGMQAVVMAPTEILAEQHIRGALKFLSPHNIRVGLLTGSLGAAERRKTLAKIASGEIQVVVGTHAIIQADVEFKRLALAIVDEQHRFGVMQRRRLMEQGKACLGKMPHMLVMTATPIPRTLALTVYGDLDVSVIDELPPGRSPIPTKRFKDKDRQDVYQLLREAVAKGRQAYVVFPLVEESEAEGLDNLRDATSAVDELANGPLTGLRLGLLHGKMSGDDKDRVMRNFAEGKIDVLISTTVIEVGIDVPNATVMVIEHAERFGLSQLHQLRGRVGRGAHQSHCYLIAGFTRSEDAWHRLRVMEQTNDGFKIAEEDLAIRGPGDFVGTRQSGLPLLTLANLKRDAVWLQKARQDAEEIMQNDPFLQNPTHRPLRNALECAWEAKLELAKVG